MIHVLTIISYDNSLLKHFVGYYTSLGVDSFIIAIDERTPTIWGSTAEIASQLTAPIKLVPVSERQKLTGVEKNNKEEMREKYVSPADWFIPADLDEFIQFPAPIDQLITEMVQEEATFINGRFSDRLSRTGALTPTNEFPPIWEQYPLEADLSSKLVKCWSTKVTLARGDCVLTSGHHHVLTPCKPLLSRKCKVHHFKWRLGLREALEKRVDTYKKWNMGSYTESERILLYLRKHDRLIPKDFDAKMGWTPISNKAKAMSVVYTAITNQYDDLKEPNILKTEETDWVAFTDSEVSSPTWRIQRAHSDFSDPCRNAKIHKILSHIYFPDAIYSLWIDGSVVIGPGFDMDNLIETYLAEHDMAVFKHRSRDCAYSEAEACIRQNKDNVEIIKRQMHKYEYETYPRNRGLAECTIILRRHTETIRQFNEIWWHEIQNHSRRDQLSFNYVAWKLGVKYSIIRGSISDNTYFNYTKHRAGVLKVL